MQTEPTRSSTQTNAAGTTLGTLCPNCRAEMPREMRFCRSCGFRLGEGVAEFTETVRFAKAPTSPAQHAATSNAQRVATAPTPQANSCGSLNDWGVLAKGVSEKAFKNITQHLEKQREKAERQREKKLQPKGQRRSHWMLWIILIIIISVVSSGGALGLKGLLRGLRVNISSASAKRSFVGVDEFKTASNGVTFDKVEPAGSPADKAGLVGGDSVTAFDGRPVKSSDELRDLLAATPIGKTVDVTYIRDGETKTTKLTTISKEELDRLEEAANSRTEGYVGIGGNYDLVPIPGTNITGVRLNKVKTNHPGYTAGLRSGDIVIEFDGVPIRTYDELESRTSRAVPDSTVKMVVMRGVERLELLVKIGVS